MILLPLLATCLVSAVATYLLARFLVIPLLKRRGVLDQPGERSSHDAAVVRGGGIAVLSGATIATVLGVVLLTLNAAHEDADVPVVALVPFVAAFAFGLVGFVDDLNSLSAIGRLVVQVLIATIVALLICFSGGVALGLGFAIFLSLILVVNGTNFMDGLNTLVPVWGAATGVWMTTWALLVDKLSVGLVVVAFACALLGFLPLNRTPAVSFLGDVGSYAIGAFFAVSGWVLWSEGVPTVILIAPFIVPLFDVLVTLGTRMLRGENLFTAHRSHIYQRLTTSGLSHEQVSALHLSATALCAISALPVLIASTWGSLAATLLLWVVIVVGYASSPGIATRRTQRAAAR